MSGTPSETELQTQWKNFVRIIDEVRIHTDGVFAGAAGSADTLLQSLEGEYTPTGLVAFSSRYRAALSDLISPDRVLEGLDPILSEYGLVIAATPGSGDGFGSAYGTREQLMDAIYEHFVANSLDVKTRAITFDTTATEAGTGDGEIKRLTVDENGEPLESVSVEKKIFRCREDQNSGVNEHAETFEMLGEPSGPDHIQRFALGSGLSTRAVLGAVHAGVGSGASLLRNSSFETYDSGATPKFQGWDLSGTGTAANVVQDTTNYYRGAPGATTPASLKITADGSNTFTLTQTRANLRRGQLSPNRPYLLRIMWNRSIGSGAGGTLKVRLGSQEVVSAAIAAQSGWQELLIPLDANCWFKNFNQDAFGIDIEWVCSTSTGYVLIDDAILVEMDPVDGTWATIIGGATSFLIDKTFEFTDTGGDPGTGGLINYYLWLAGLRSLPSDAIPSFADPT